tara:strand:- start:821 stop:997 length:177 start_codon:yes stop_codon:yes gene_type:complete
MNKVNYTPKQLLTQRLQTLNALKGNLQSMVSGITTISDFCNTVEESIRITKKQIEAVK